ncbi:hypothetical protein E4T49_03520 [Aureobasidium sp. EXF-10728]|nr:hypothetical protein E4T49_03520 [Aureobasidium sp. EXF-10728]
MSTEGITLIYSNNGTVIGADYYAYTPSVTAGWAFVGLFGVSTVLHLGFMFRGKSVFFIPLIIGGIMETFGYYGRAWAGSDPHNFGAWALQAFLIICAPPMISATVYMSLGRTIRALEARENALMSPRATTPLFVIGDLIAFISQLAGVGLQAARSASANANGKKIVLAGLIFQLILFLFFITNIIVFDKRNSKNPSRLSMHPQIPRWKRRVWTLYLVSGCILLRNFVRVVEYAQGGNGQITTHEVFVYVFDAALMWLAMTAFLVVHPGRLLKKAAKVKEGLAKSQNEEGIPMTAQYDSRA